MKNVMRFLLFTILFTQISFAPWGDWGSRASEPKTAEENVEFAKTQRSDGLPQEEFFREQQARFQAQRQAESGKAFSGVKTPSPKVGVGFTEDGIGVGVDRSGQQGVNVDDFDANTETKPQAEAQDSQEDLLDEVDRNIAKRVKFKKYLKWGDAERLQIRQLADQYAQEFGRAAGLSPEQQHDFEVILTEGLMKNASVFSRVAELQASVPTVMYRFVEANMKILKGEAYQKQGPWSVEGGRFDLRTTDARFKDVLDALSKEPFADLHRLNLSKDVKEKFIQYARNIVEMKMDEDKSVPRNIWDNTVKLIQHSHLIPEALLATALLSVVITIIVEVEKGKHSHGR